MAYVGDATSHAALLSAAPAPATDLSAFAGVLIVVLVMAPIVAALSESNVSTDALLVVLAHGALALGLIAMSPLPVATWTFMYNYLAKFW